MSLATQSISALRQQLTGGEITSRDIVQSVAAAIDSTNDSIGAYLSRDLDRALAAADAADLSLPLGGIPIAMKDNINVQGEPCTCGSKFLHNAYLSPYDATASRKLRESGAVLFGRTNMDEFAMGSSTENSALQVTRNPHDLDRIPGGSVRQPASHCGVVGLKPSYGRVSRYGLVAFASSLDQIGPLTNSVEDAALLLQAIAGPDPRDSTCLEQPVPAYRESLNNGVKGTRIGLPAEYFGEGLDPAVRERIESAAKALEAQGAELVELSLPSTRHAVATYYIIAPAEASSNLSRFDGIRYGNRVDKGTGIVDLYGTSRAAGFGAEVKRRIILGTYVLSSGYYDAYYTRAQKVRTLIQQEFQAAFQKVDAILGPVSPSPARKIGDAEGDPLKDYLADIYTISANLAGVCAISVPAGTVPSDNGKQLPVGLQLIGPHLAEETILRIAKTWEDVR
jgi:aspartyl-tRNA(Asn)/glutamyl-tRNA(Gln) amidotransferase subunit A